MEDSFADSREALGYARKRFQNINDNLNRLFGAEPCTIVSEPDPQTGEIHHKARLKSPIPPELSFVAFDIINQCRSALDRAGFAMAIAAGNPKPKSTHFPFGDDAASIYGCKTGMSKDIPDEIFAYMASLHPHKGGNVLLWAMNKAWNINKHRLIVPQFLSAGGLRFSDIRGVINKFSIPVHPTGWDSTKNELTFLITPPNYKAQHKVQFLLTITFGEIEGIVGAPVLPTLEAMIGLTEDILADLEMIARGTGLIP